MSVPDMLDDLIEKRLVDLCSPEHRARFAEFLARADINRILPAEYIDKQLKRLAGHLPVEKRNARFEALKAAVMWRQTAHDTGDENDIRRACADVDKAVHDLVGTSATDSPRQPASTATGGDQ